MQKEIEMVDGTDFANAVAIVGVRVNHGNDWQHHALVLKVVMENEQDEWPSHAELSEAVRSVTDLENMFFYIEDELIVLHYDVANQEMHQVVHRIGSYLEKHCWHEPIKALDVIFAAVSTYWPMPSNMLHKHGWQKPRQHNPASI